LLIKSPTNLILPMLRSFTSRTVTEVHSGGLLHTSTILPWLPIVSLQLSHNPRLPIQSKMCKWIMVNLVTY